MKRWLILLLLLIPCNGCMAMEEMLFGDDPPHGYPSPQPAGACGVPPITSVAASQTAEPELLQMRK